MYNEPEVINVYAEQIRLLRQQKGLSQQMLGEMLGVSAVAVGKWERGQTQPDIPTLMRLAEIFEVSVDELCGYQPVSPRQDGNISVMTRAFGRLTHEEQDKYIAVGKALFPHVFAEEKK